MDDELKGSQEDDAENERNIWSPTLLMAGDERGNLHFLLGGAISLGTINLGKQTDIISAFIANSRSKPGTPLSPTSHNLSISVLMSVPNPYSTGTHLPALPGAVLDAMLPRKDLSQGTQTVMRCLIDIPHFPSEEITSLARAASAFRICLSLAFEALDDARKAWEEAKEMGRKWLDRLKDDESANLPSFQLILLLLTGRPANANMHDYLASKNTERASRSALFVHGCEKWS